MMFHEPVLYREIIHALQPTSNGLYVDGTIGAGGHAYGILEASAPNGCLLGLDLDPAALDLARDRLENFGDRAVLVQDSYITMEQHINNLGWDAVDGILLDLGLSSMQLDTPARGFSFREDAPLDMRFDPSASLTAADLVNELPENELANIIYNYGEEKYSRKIARAIVAARPIHTTQELASLVSKMLGRFGSRIHPATRTFQALRIAVNQELAAIETVLPIALGVLKPGGRLAVISFHSLEDRIVKQFFRYESRNCICPPELPICVCDHQAQLREIVRRPIRPEESEIKRNPRARSACLRVAEKL
ncbi:MAG: 16S rRNA (cytosine(1402)-N(4))-methyltransferase [Anaerolineaceae bacterium 4572_5.1]|nr:MAG: 16S rRNA (cytosine(1402)-N(4))-methyltransferase [Anaerolineaceae bacterium 4572_5.1]